ncbi:MAG TPA: enoyl-CoA hydratase-related protein, partial [Hyphomicrobiaceae bacterium]|nr:enoyl-CoA hydratase-related protein [Hyphomicrobiaceae bacterium]
SAAEALRMGIASEVVGKAALEAETRKLAAEISANAPLSIVAAKRSIDAMVDQPESVDMAMLDKLVEACFESADYTEGTRAFLEKRKPRFEGR